MRQKLIEEFTECISRIKIMQQSINHIIAVDNSLCLNNDKLINISNALNDAIYNYTFLTHQLVND